MYIDVSCTDLFLNVPISEGQCTDVKYEIYTGVCPPGTPSPPSLPNQPSASTPLSIDQPSGDSNGPIATGQPVSVENPPYNGDQPNGITHNSPQGSETPLMDKARTSGATLPQYVKYSTVLILILLAHFL